MEIIYKFVLAIAASKIVFILLKFISVKCQQKRVKRAYYIVCQNCADGQGICAKCGEKADIVKK